MSSEGRLMDMLTGYAAAHRHPLNVVVHLIGIPTIMLGALIPLTWLATDVGGVHVTAAHLLVFGFFVFYLTLDAVFAGVFLVFGLLVAELAVRVGAMPPAVAGTIAAVAFFGGYAAQFIGHAVERSMPVLVRHPIQANLAAPFFQVVEVFKMLGLRTALFDQVQKKIDAVREQNPAN